ncbi:MAG TPA: hypothetical protein VEH27_12495 [Methylomirabilota bacterium]|nr:hypothetical protein [Methylomirabilota bacterium]
MNSTGGFRVRILNNIDAGLALQGSADLRSWTTIQENVPVTLDTTVTDNSAGAARQRFYRLAKPSPVVQLPELATLPNQVFTASEGFDTVQFAPSGALGMIVWKNQNLVYRERNTSGSWSEATISSSGRTFTAGSREEFRFQPHAALLFNSVSQPVVIRYAGGASFVAHTRQANGAWAEQTIAAQNAGSDFVFFAASMGAGDKLHIAVVNSGDNPSVSYGSNKSGSWSWSRVAGIVGNPRRFLAQSYAPRYFGMAVDSRNKAHIVYTPELEITFPTGYAKPYSKLGYASDASGAWQTEIVMSPRDWSGDAGTGASIAIAPGDVPVVASWMVERADTGSSQESYLYYHVRGANGTWNKTMVVSSPQNYAAGDGPKGTGFAPYLRFDTNGRAHILFLDHAAEHFNESGQNEYAGNLRLASWNGSSWTTKTLVQQTNPLQGQMVYPAFAVNGNEIAYLTLQRATTWLADSWPRQNAISAYTMRFGTATAQ